LVADDEHALLQLQTDRFHLNWRAGDDNAAYINYEKHVTRFLSYWQQFCDFLGQPDAVLRGAEISKVSHLRAGEGWNDLNEVANALTALSWTPTLSSSFALKNIAAAFATEHSDGHARVEVKTGSLKSEPTRRVLVLEIHTVVTGLTSSMKDIGNLSERLSAANGVANLLFTSITTTENQLSAWGRTK
jgi:hypothetical protein